MSKSKIEPESVSLYTYKVGFGDCFLLTFNYSGGDKRNMLIDFGSTQKPAGMPKEASLKDLMLKIANDIKEKCKDPKTKKSKLHVLVASHRHKDHISGFACKKDSKSKDLSGDIIKSLKPDLVIQPWTEDPTLSDEEVWENFNKGKCDSQEFRLNSEKYHALTLHNMQKVAQVINSEAERLGRHQTNEEYGIFGFIHTISPEMKEQLGFMSENNLPNKNAVENLREMGERDVDGVKAGHYVKFWDKIELEKIIPGVTVKVLGPPDLEQHQEIIKQRSRDDEEFWMLHSMLEDFWGTQAVTAELTETFADWDEDNDKRLFKNAKVYQNYAPSHNRWFIRQIREGRAEQLLGLVRILDKAINNTSLILLFQANKKNLLFPGDAQIENWEYALSKSDVVELLSETDLYKVGHHGSRNATPKSLWKIFKKKSEDEKPEQLKTIMSTLSGKHGHSEATAVPKQTLVRELNKYSNLFSTEQLDKDELYKEDVIDLT